MNDTASTVLFTILAFSLGFVLIMKKDTIPPHMRKFLAIVTIVLISSSFFLIVLELLGLGS